MKRLIICAGLLSAVAVSAQADIMLYGWNDGTSGGWSNVSRYSTTTGVTEGTGAAVFNVTGWMAPALDWHDTLTFAPYQQLAGHTVIKYDMTTVAPSPNGWENFWASLIFEGNNGVYYKTELPAFRMTNGTASFDYSTVAGGSITAGTGGSLNLQIMLNPAGGWTGGEVVVDNFRIETVVPEPTSIGLIAVGSMLALKRRRTI